MISFDKMRAKVFNLVDQNVWLLFLSYLLGAEFGHFLSFKSENFATFWPPSGILLGFFLVSKPRRWTSLALASLLANIASDLFHQKHLLISCGFWIGNVSEALAGALLMRKCRALSEVGHVSLRTFWFLVAIPAVFCTLISSIIGTIIVAIAFESNNLLSIWSVWWVSDFLGIILFTPTVLSLFFEKAAHHSRRTMAAEKTASFVCLLLFAGVVFGKNFGQAFQVFFAFTFMVYPILLWMAVRTGVRHTSIGLIALTAVVVWNTAHGFGPFVTPNDTILLRVFLVQLYIGITSLSFFTLSIVFAERNLALTTIEEKIKTLGVANNDLAQFAYIASHDLQEPLRAVASYVALIEKRYDSLLDEKGRGYIRHVVDGANRMHALVNDILAYSGAGSGQIDFEWTDCNALVKGIAEDMATAFADQKPVIDWADLPVINTAPSMIRQILQNLISNAIKFHSEKVPKIRISASSKDGSWVFAVADNGIGIAEQHHDRIFRLFERLHGRERYPGTGLGLAICKKSVALLGGNIWLSSEPDIGSVFYFSLPRKEILK